MVTPYKISVINIVVVKSHLKVMLQNLSDDRIPCVVHISDKLGLSIPHRLFAASTSLL